MRVRLTSLTSQIVANAVGNPRRWFGGVSLNDLIWHQAIMTMQELEFTHPRSPVVPDEDDALWSILATGLIDPSDHDGRWATAIRSMRYSALMGERLWSMIGKEKSRVG